MGAMTSVANLLGAAAGIGLQAAQGLAAQQQAAARRQAEAQQYRMRQHDLAAERRALDDEARARRDAAQADIGRLQADQAEADRRRRNALRRSVAKRRAALGAKGIDATAGSGEALLLGLVDESALQGAEARRRTGDRVAEIRRDLDDRQRLNLLERSRLHGQQRLNQAAYRADIWAGRARAWGRARDTVGGIAGGLARL